MRGKPTPAERFWAKFRRHPETGCWLWTAAVDQTTGYAKFAPSAGRTVNAHRFAYELLVGPVPENLDLDHVKSKGCRFRHCVNPMHLEPVTRQENLRRGDTLAAAHAEGRDCLFAGCKTCYRFHRSEVDAFLVPDPEAAA